MLTWTTRGALNVTNSAVGQENALSPGISHEVLIAEPHSPQDTHTAPTDPVTEPTLNPVQSSNVFDEEVCLLYTSPSPRDGLLSRMPSSA